MVFEIGGRWDFGVRYFGFCLPPLPLDSVVEILPALNSISLVLGLLLLHIFDQLLVLFLRNILILAVMVISTKLRLLGWLALGDCLGG